MTNEDFACMAACEASERALNAYQEIAHAARDAGLGLSAGQRAIIGSALLEAFFGFEESLRDMARVSDLMARLAPYSRDMTPIGDEVERWLAEQDAA